MVTDRYLLRRVIELETLTHDTSQRLGRALRNLDQALGGYPATTPGSGSPGGGKSGSTRTIIVPDELDPEAPADQIPVTSVEALVLSGHADLPAEELASLRLAAIASSETLTGMVNELTGQLPVFPPPDARLIQHIVQAYRCAIVCKGLASDGHFARSSSIEACEKPIQRLHRIVHAWSFTPGRPAIVRAQPKPVDLTGMYCVSCLRVGEKEVRYRRDLCRWCYTFETTEDFPVPIEIIEARHIEHRVVTDTMVRPFRQAHRDRLQNDRTTSR